MFIEPRHCEQCGKDISQAAKFCSACGTAVPEKVQPKCPTCGIEVQVEGQHCKACSEAVPIDIPSSNPEQLLNPETEVSPVLEELEKGADSSDESRDSEGATAEQPGPAKRSPRKTLLVIASLIIAGSAFALFSPGQEVERKVAAETSSETTQVEEPPLATEEPELPFLALDQVLNTETLKQVATGICSPLEAKVLSQLSLTTYRSHMSDLGEIEDSYGARDFAAANPWASSQFLNEYEAGINGLLSKTLIDNSNWDESEYQVDTDSWVGSFINLALETCDLELLFEDTHLAIVNLQGEADRVMKLASEAPWYPKGFEEVPVNPSYAYGFDIDEECNSLAESCAVFEIVSLTACSELTLFITFFDKDDSEVDSTVTFVRSLKANQPMVVNVSSLEKAETFAIESLTCG